MIDFFSSLSLLNSTALIGFFSLVVPIAIHLINTSRGRIVLIGKIDFVKQPHKLSVTELKLTQWLLLLIRLTLLFLLSLLIAQLMIQSQPNYFDNNHVYLSNDWLGQANNKELNKLLENHVDDDIFLLNNQFEKISDSKPLTIKKLLSAQLNLNKNSYTNTTGLLYELERKNKHPKQTIIYITNRLQQFTDNKFSFSTGYQWKVKSLNLEDLIEADTAPIVIDVFFDNSRATDKDYLMTAFNYLNQVNQKQRKILVNYHLISEVSALNTKNINQSKHHWIIWLAHYPPTADLFDSVKKGAYLLTDIKNSSSSEAIKTQLILIEGELISFYQALNNIESNQELSTDLRTPSGYSILGTKLLGKGKILHFASRFNPAWTNLVETEAFPIWLNKLLTEAIDTTQDELIAPAEISLTNPNKSNTIFNKTPLYPWLILIISLLWLVERSVAENILPFRLKSNSEANGHD